MRIDRLGSLAGLAGLDLSEPALLLLLLPPEVCAAPLFGCEMLALLAAASATTDLRITFTKVAFTYVYATSISLGVRRLRERSNPPQNLR